MNEIHQTIHNYINTILSPTYYASQPTEYDIKGITHIAYIKRHNNYQKTHTTYSGYIEYNATQMQITFHENKLKPNWPDGIITLELEINDPQLLEKLTHNINQHLPQTNEHNTTSNITTPQTTNNNP